MRREKIKFQYRYVESQENPADIATRGCHIDDLENSLWWTAPLWLKKNQEEWLRNKILYNDFPEP